MPNRAPVSAASTRRKKALSVGAPSRNADESRARIFEAAKVRFSQGTYDGVGVREIAADAGIDPALVLRYFGSKEGLFREIAARAFGTEELLKDGLSALPDNTGDVLLGEVDDRAWREGYDPLRFLLASIGSPIAGPILAEYLGDDFVRPLAAAVGGEEAAERGAIVAALIVGFALVRLALVGKPGGILRREVSRSLLVGTVRGLIAHVDAGSKRDDGKRERKARAPRSKR